MASIETAGYTEPYTVRPHLFLHVVSFFEAKVPCLVEWGVSETQVKPLGITAATGLNRVSLKTGMEQVRWCVGFIATVRMRTGVCCAEEGSLGVEGGCGNRMRSGEGRSVGFLMERDTER